MSRFAETQPVRGRRTARAVTDSPRLAAGSRSATVDSDCKGTAKACRAPSSESNPKGMSRCDDWLSSESRVGDSLFGETTIGHGHRVCPRQISRRGFSRSSRRLAVVVRASPAAVTSGFGRRHLRGAAWCGPSGSHRELGPFEPGGCYLFGGHLSGPGGSCDEGSDPRGSSQSPSAC